MEFFLPPGTPLWPWKFLFVCLVLFSWLFHSAYFQSPVSFEFWLCFQTCQKVFFPGLPPAEVMIQLPIYGHHPKPL